METDEKRGIVSAVNSIYGEDDVDGEDDVGDYSCNGACGHYSGSDYYTIGSGSPCDGGCGGSCGCYGVGGYS
ncbi:Hypothetical predicted protein [Octopus vulgaris]|uniref:Uncharacterized protein n=1 Tax=Octopus vulgaris TaxID=6645 RepID=A0AA36BZY8_OCTVU|nr:Hypothetical predicted protein [Octopus vulgaris]